MSYRRLRASAWLEVALLVALAASAVAVDARAANRPIARPDYGPVIRAIDERVPAAMARNHVPGMAIALIDGDSVVWSKGFGGTADSVPITDTTLFSVQSISKTYTAAVVLRAVELGWLKLDDALLKHVPDFAVRSRFGTREVKKITIRHLLAHRASLPHEALVGSNFDDSNASFEEHIRSVSQSWLLCPVGARFSYSNLGVDLAGHALERIARRPFPAIADSLLFQPLGMRRSTFDFDTARRLGAVTDGHVGDRTLPARSIPIMPSGGMYSTVRDMGRFVAYMMTDTSRTLSVQHRTEMATPQFPVLGQTAGYGLGLQHVPAFGAVRLSHSGGGFGYSAEQRWIPAYGVGVVVLANQEENGMGPAVAAGVMQLMLQAKLGSVPRDTVPVPQASEGITLPLDRLRRLEGEYKSTGPLVTLAVRGDRLVQMSPADTTELGARGPNDFFAGRRTYRFAPDAGGRIAGVEVIDPNYATNGAEFWPLNRSPRDTPGPNRPEWTAITGDYELSAFGRRVTIRIYVRDGDLYTSWRGGLRLTRFGPDRYFTPEGEVMEFRRGGEMILAGRRFHRRLEGGG